MLRYPHDLDEDAFGKKKGSGVRAFDAFPKAKPQFVTRTAIGGKWTVAMILFSFVLVYYEFRSWWLGNESQSFSVEKGVGHDMQINLDMVIAMPCHDIHLNVQDAAGDRILAGEKLKSDKTNWAQWVNMKGIHQLGRDEHGRLNTVEENFDDEGFGEDHARDIVATAGWRRSKFAKTPKIRGQPSEGNSCRIYGILEVNKVQGEFHVTARGHGYLEFGNHLSHDAFNFSHIISELSFGDYYPSLSNPLDGTTSSSPHHFQKHQYFLSIVPTIYSIETTYSDRAVYTNQYAVTEQSQEVDEHSVPGIFFKYDIEPMLLVVEESRDSFLRFLIKVVNVFSGALVAGHWGFTLSEWAKSVFTKKKKGTMDGVLNGRALESSY